MPDLEGRLDLFEPISVLQMLNLACATGELRLKSGRNSARIYFNCGSVSYAEIAEKPMKLGEHLVSRGLLSSEELERCLAKKEAGKRIGDVLIEEGCLDEATLREAVEEQIKTAIYEVVKWKSGVFVFTSGKEPRGQDVLIDVPLDHLVLEGLKRMDEEEGKSG